MRSLLPTTFDVMRDFAQALSVEEVHAILLAHVNKFGVESVLAAVIPDRIIRADEQHKFLVLGRWPQGWIERYFTRQYVLKDPTIAHSRFGREPLWWDEIELAANHPGRRVMDEAKEYRLVAGITIPQLTLDGHRVAISFSGKRLEKSPQTEMMLTVMAAYAVNRALEIRTQIDFMPGKLTPREREVLLRLSEGLSNSEIAAKLAMSVWNVDKLSRSIRGKLRALTTAQAVASGIRFGLI